MLLSAVFLWLYLSSTTTRAEAFGFWGLSLALFRHVSQLEGKSSWLSRLGWGLGEAEVSIVVSIRIMATLATFEAPRRRTRVITILFLVPLSLMPTLRAISDYKPKAALAS